MSGDGGAPPSGAGKPAILGSTFINKGAGKKFAPKAAARRRPAAAAPATVAPATPPVEPSAPQKQQPAAPESQAEATPQAALPTPSATQDTATPAQSQTAGVVVEPPPPTAEPSTTESASPAPEAQPTSTRARPKSPRAGDGNLQSGKSPERQRIETNVEEEAATTYTQESVAQTQATDIPAAESQVTESQFTETQITESQPATQVVVHDAQAPLTDSQIDAELAGAATAVPPVETNEDDAAAPASQQNQAGRGEASKVQAPTAAPRSKRTRTLPWTAINQPQGGPVTAQGAQRKKLPAGFWLQTRKGKEARERAEQSAEQEGEHGEERDEEQGDGQEAAEEEANTQQRTRSGRATKRRRPVAQEDGDDDDENDAFEPVAPPKKKRNAPKKASTKAVKKTPRKKKTQTPSSGDQGAEVDGAAQPADGAAQSADGAVQQPSRRRGRARREREPTPDEAEDEEIDPEKTLMFSLAKRNTRTGKLSEREKKMRQINWAEVRQRQREEDMVVPDRWETQREVNERLAKAAEEAQEAENAQYRPGNAMALVDGEFVNVRPTRNRAQEEQDAFDAQEIIEEDDLTQRVTQKSFMRDNKRFPQDFMLPGQGKRWTQELTDKFYQALEIFRTDFAMINTIFPGMTRRSIKLKFNREEREHPERIKIALRSQRVFDEELSKEEKISRVWTDYLSRADKTNDAFLDADRIKAELAAEEEQMREQIEEAKAQHAADKEQRRKAGLPVEDDEIAAAAEKENAGKKKRKKRDKQPAAFAAEEGVEILGEIDD